MVIKLGKLKNVNLRNVWSHEAQDFTPCLAENLEYLLEELGMLIQRMFIDSSNPIKVIWKIY